MDAARQPRDFKGVWIDREVWFDSNLNALDKIILTEINSLDGEDGCYASNRYIAEFCGCSESKVSKSIAKLIDLGYITLKSFNGRTRVLQCCLVKNARQTSTKSEAAEQIMPAININNNIKKKQERKKESYDDIINELCDNEMLKETMYEFIKMRQLIKKPLTDYALRRILAKLEEISGGDLEQKIEILAQSITNNWQGVFPLKKDYADKRAAQNKTDRWYHSDEPEEDLPF